MTFRYGRRAAVRPVGLRDLTAYLRDPLPAGPASVPVPDVARWGMLGNDRVGDCTIAGVEHVRIANAAEHGEQIRLLTADEVVGEYFQLTGGEDDGCDEATVLSAWQRDGLCGERICGYAPVDHRNLDEIRSVTAGFGACYLGIVVPSNMEQQFTAFMGGTGSGFTAASGTLTQDGHCVVIVGYTPSGPQICTWGAVVPATWAWLSWCLEEAWAVLTVEDDRVDHVTLTADLAKIGR